MDKKDLFIKSKLQEDKNIPKEIDELIKNFKGGDIKMENNFNKSGKGKVAKIIAIAACFILVALVGVALLGQQNGQIIKVGGKDKVEGRKEVEIKQNNDVLYNNINENEEKNKVVEENNINTIQTEIEQNEKIIVLNESNIHSYLGTMSSRFCIENIEKNGDKYTITAYIIDTPRIITKTEMEDLRLGKSITFRNKEWTAATNPNGENVLTSGEDMLRLIENTEKGTGQIDNMAGAAVPNGLRDYATKVKFEVENNILIGSIWNDFKFDNNENVVAYENDEVVNNFTSITFEKLLEMSQKNIGTYEECQAFINNGTVKAIKLFNY